MGTDVLQCRDIADLSTEYAEGALTTRRRIAFRFHLLVCRMCRAYMDQLAKTRRLLGGRPLDAGPRAEDEVLARLPAKPGRFGDDG